MSSVQGKSDKTGTLQHGKLKPGGGIKYRSINKNVDMNNVKKVEE